MSTLLSGLLAYYTLDNTANDSYGGHHGVSEEMTYTTAKLGTHSADFNGSGHITVTHGSWLNVSSISISFWMRATSWSVAYTSVISKQQTNSPWPAFDLRKSGSNNQLEAWVTSGGSGNTFYSVTELSTSTWYHIVLTYDAASHTGKMYQDGVGGTSQTGFSGNMDTTTTDMWFGGNAGAGGRYFTGQIDDIGIWDRALTSGEVSELYNSGSGKTWPWSVNRKLLGGRAGLHLIDC